MFVIIRFLFLTQARTKFSPIVIRDSQGDSRLQWLFIGLLQNTTGSTSATVKITVRKGRNTDIVVKKKYIFYEWMIYCSWLLMAFCCVTGQEGEAWALNSFLQHSEYLSFSSSCSLFYLFVPVPKYDDRIALSTNIHSHHINICPHQEPLASQSSRWLI